MAINNAHILEYAKAIDLKNAILNNAFSDGIFITATAEVAQVFRDMEQVGPERVLEMNILLQRLLPSWYDDNRALSDFIELGNIIQTHMKDIMPQEAAVLLNNRMDIIRSIRTLLEMGITPKCVTDITPDLALFKKVYKLYWKKSSIPYKFFTSMTTWCNTEEFKNKMKRIVVNRNPQLGKKHFSDVHKIYLHGFYYTTPIQTRLIEAFSKAGYEIVFVNNVDNAVVDAYQVFKRNRHFTVLASETLPSAVDVLPNFHEIYDHTPIKQNQYNNVKIYDFPSIFSFVNYLNKKMDGDKNTTTKVNVFSPNGNDLQDFFDVFFPESDRKRHLLAYPVGQYLFQLYQCWDAQSDEIRLDVDKIRICIATGWAGRHASDIHKNLGLFDRAKEFFSDCHTLQEWEDRMNLITHVQKEVLPIFTGEKGGTRWEKTLASPLRFVGAYNISQDEMQVLCDELQDIFSDIKLLFSDGWIDLNRHFKVLNEMIESKFAYKAMSDQERDAVAKIVYKLKNNPTAIDHCRAHDLSTAMAFYLGGTLDKNENEEPDGHGIADVEATLLKAENNPSVVCFCDSTHLPGHTKTYSWPLSKDVLLSFKKLSEQAEWLCIDYLYYMESAALSDRYLFFLSLQLPYVEYSWVSENNGREFDKSAYLTVLSEDTMYGIKIDTWNNPAENDIIKTENNSKVLPDTVDFLPADYDGEEPLLEFKYNDIYCPYRNVYDFGLQELPDISDRFQLKFYLSMFMRFLKGNVGSTMTLEEIAEKVFSIVPILNDAEKKQIIYWSSYGKENLANFRDQEQKYHGETYLHNRLYLKYLNSSIVEKLTSRERPSIKPNSQHCTYCPNREYCYYKNRTGSEK